ILLLFREVKLQFEFRGNKVRHFIFVAALGVVIPFYVGVTGVRFWPALFLFTWCILKYLSSNKSKFIFLSGVSMLIHYSFFVPFSILILYYFFPIKGIVSYALVFISIAFYLLTSTNSIFN